MSQEQTQRQLPAPCIVDFGTIVNKDDMKRLLDDLCHVRYIHTIDNQFHTEGKGWVQEVFNDPYQSTLIANGNLYINLQSFDYLKLSQSSTKETYFDLVQDNRQLRLIPLSNLAQEQTNTYNFNAAAIEAMVTEVLSAHLDVQLDDDDF
ncbi:hypothetical protein IQ238_28175 [Pleurocapsales cyanobacterium LEGE 06147]|nr:hypothetical protein [Pleurocapsales cyanobacterium LEGE 06147]